MIRCTWQDGVVTEAATWEELTGAVLRLPWNRNAPSIKHELARRAYVWSGELINPLLPDEDLWRELERLGLCELSLDS